MTKTQSQAAEQRGELGVPLLRGNSQRKNRLIPTATDFLSMDQHDRGNSTGSRHQQHQPRSGNGGSGSNKTLGLYCILFLIFWFSRENLWGTLEGMWLRDAGSSVEEGVIVASGGEDGDLGDDGRLDRGRTRTTDKYVPAPLAELLVADGVPKGPPPSPRNPKDGMVPTEEMYLNGANDEGRKETRKDNRHGRRLLRERQGRINGT